MKKEVPLTARKAMTDSELLKEEGWLTYEELRILVKRQPGVSPRTVATRFRRPLPRLAPNPLARRVKLADLKDNMDMTRLPNPGPKDLARLERYKAAWEKLDGPPL